MFDVETFRVNDLENYLEGLNRLFDIVRVVDPIKKKILHCNDGEAIMHGADCYEFWSKGKFCANCISKKAMIEKDTITKIEYYGDGLFLAMASVIEFEDNEYVIEMLKDITEIGMLSNLNCDSMIEIRNRLTELNEKIMRDDLTGVYNRRYINERLPREIHNATVNNEKISVVMLDIDHFKQINDIYGHIAGDLVLKEFIKIIKSKIRKNYDWVARFGGDEFLIVLKNSDKETTNLIIKGIQVALSNNIIRFNNYLIKTTISFGSYTVEPGIVDVDEILYIVDKNLNKAKNSGRNKLISS